jgi:hypothetical protein
VVEELKTYIGYIIYEFDTLELAKYALYSALSNIAILHS